MNTIRLKCWPEMYEEVRLGNKPFEVRGTEDRKFEKGDTLILEEFFPHEECKGRGWYLDETLEPVDCSCMSTEFPKGRYSGRTLARKVTFVTSWGQVNGNVVMGLSIPKAPPPAITEAGQLRWGLERMTVHAENLLKENETLKGRIDVLESEKKNSAAAWEAAQAHEPKKAKLEQAL